MGFFDLFKKKEERNLNYNSGIYLSNSTTNYTTNNSMKLSAVFACVNAISQGVAVLPINVLKTDKNGYCEINTSHPLYQLFKLSPDAGTTTIFNFLKIIVQEVILAGNAYAYIERDERGKVKKIKYIPSNKIQIYLNEDRLLYQIVGQPQYFEASDILHFKLHSNNGISGISVLEFAKNSLQLAADSEEYANNFFKNGASNTGIFKKNTPGNFSDQQKEGIRKNWSLFASSTNNSAVPFLPNEVDYIPLNLKPADQQLLESRNFDVEQISRFFHVNPIKIFQLQKSSYSNLEQVQLSFLWDTLKPYLTMIENEMNLKLFLPSERIISSLKFDESKMLSTDKQSLAEYYSKLLDKGILSVNEIRKEINYNEIENGDEHYIQLNMSTLKNINKPTSN